MRCAACCASGKDRAAAAVKAKSNSRGVRAATGGRASGPRARCVGGAMVAVRVMMCRGGR